MNRRWIAYLVLSFNRYTISGMSKAAVWIPFAFKTACIVHMWSKSFKPGKVIGTIEPGMMRHPSALGPMAAITCLIILVAFQISGCSTTKPPTETLASAELTMRTAVEARADELAPMDLQRAREKLEGSKKAMASGKYEEARRLAEIAQVEAELAEAKADAEIIRRAADGLRQAVDALRQEMERGMVRGTSTGKPKE
jgi:hypothetical protein